MVVRRGGGRTRERLRFDSRSLRQLYVSLPLSGLRTMEQAFLLEASLTESALVAAFCKRHLTLIASVIVEKEERRGLRKDKPR